MNKEMAIVEIIHQNRGDAMLTIKFVNSWRKQETSKSQFAVFNYLNNIGYTRAWSSVVTSCETHTKETIVFQKKS